MSTAVATKGPKRADTQARAPEAPRKHSSGVDIREVQNDVRMLTRHLVSAIANARAVDMRNDSDAPERVSPRALFDLNGSAHDALDALLDALTIVHGLEIQVRNLVLAEDEP